MNLQSLFFGTVLATALATCGAYDAADLAEPDLTDVQSEPLTALPEPGLTAVQNEGLAASIVAILSKTPATSGQPGSLTVGTGFAVDARGLIATADHLLGNGDDYSVILADGSEREARLVDRADWFATALLQLAQGPMPPPLPWGDARELKLGDRVSIAHASAGPLVFVTYHVVSTKMGATEDDPLHDTKFPFLALEPGVQVGGAPVLNSGGAVVGMTVANLNNRKKGEIYTLAPTSSLVRAPVEQVLRTGRVRRPWVGLRLHYPGILSRRGAVVAGLDIVSPAARAGLRRGDVIHRFGEREIESAAELLSAIELGIPGETVNIAAERDGVLVEVPVTISELPKAKAN